MVLYMKSLGMRPFALHQREPFWRVSGAHIISFGLGHMALYYSVFSYPKGIPFEFSFLLALLFIWFWMCLFYVVARTYLAVECFIILIHPPAGVYDVARWSAY